MAVDEKASYYDMGGIEQIEISKAKLTEQQFIGAMLFNIQKYSGRCNWKGCFRRDIEKIGIYQKMLVEYIADKVLPDEDAEENIIKHIAEYC